MSECPRSVESWLEAADRMRARARRACDHAAHARTDDLAWRFESEADCHLAAADQFEIVAVNTFEIEELELGLTRRTVHRLA